ncbi:MAG: cell division/cell wall cluster transcriptional repressor MraZ [Planctomycetes bacterium]|nr:cell division/cell wall cluster transcriptional repressor MraZ [Planctomycetota bacterium]
MFLGEFTHTLDEKNRIVIPASFRIFITDPQDREGFFVIVSPNPEERCLRLYTMSQWKRVSDRLREQAGKLEDPSAVLRFFATRGQFAPVDSQSRMVVPQKLLDHAGLRREVVLVGMMQWIEVWNVEEYREETQRLKSAPVDVKKALWSD